MPRLPILKTRQIVSALERAGFRKVRQKGSHIQLKRGNLLVTVPDHGGDVQPFVLKSILRQARITLEELEDLLK